MADETITYSPLVSGWPSRYSWHPENIIAANNYLYTFKGGNLYRHNVNPIRNQFYGVNYPSTIKLVFNENILDNKLYKAIGIQGSHPWEVVNIETDIQNGSFIEESYFEKKEQVFFAFIRNPQAIPATEAEFALRTLSGIGRSLTVTGAPNALHINFSINPVISIGSILSIGDSLYYSPPPFNTPVYCGEVTNIVQNYPNGDNYIEVDTTVSSGSIPTDQTDYFLSIKNQIAESAGILGHYAVIDIENNSTEKVELFGLQAEIMRSFP